MRKTLTTACLMGGLFLGQTAFADMPSGAMLGNTCAGCHGTDGVSKGSAASIKGLPIDHFVKTMQDFKSGKRPATIMDRIAKGYSDEEFRAMAEYFANLK